MFLKNQTLSEQTSSIKQVLYIEDNQANRQLMIAFFSKQKRLVLNTVETGEQALEKLSEQTFDLILMDIHLPDIDGKVLTKYLRETPHYQNIPVIAVTAAAMVHDIEDAEGLFDAYITKPINFVALIEVLKKYT